MLKSISAMAAITISAFTLVAGSSSLAVEREMKESGEKMGTECPAQTSAANLQARETDGKGERENTNTRVGELQECTISKSAD